MRFTFFVFLFTGVSLFGHQANSAPAEQSMPPSWTGPYVGVNGGYSWGTAKNSFLPGASGIDYEEDSYNVFADYGTGGTFKQGLQGGLLGGHIGFNQQWGKFVLGLEGSFDGSWLSKYSVNPLNLDATDEFPLVPPGVYTSYRTNIKWVSSLTPRLGYAFNNWLSTQKVACLQCA